MRHLFDSPIGVFDSGLGGLTVLREIEKLLPSEHIIYFGDTARLPYGTKSKQTIMRFSTENALFLLKKKVKCIVIACNTSSSLALDYLQNTFTVPIIGVITASVKRALAASQKKRIGVIGTRSTITSGRYQKELLRLNKCVVIYPQACPLFVPLVEEGLLRGPLVESVVKMYLHGIKGKVDTLILGCTHYPLLKKTIAHYLKGVTLIDSAQAVALATTYVLKEKELLAHRRHRGRRDFYVTDEPKGFAKVARIFLKKDIEKPRLVNV